MGKDRLTAAVAEAMAKFNLGNSHIAQMLELMNIPANASAPSALEAMNSQDKEIRGQLLLPLSKLARLNV